MRTASSPAAQELLTTQAVKLVAAARTVLKDPGRRAQLRRGLGKPPEHPAMLGAHRTVARHVPSAANPAAEWAFYAVAALIAAQPRTARDAEIDATAEEGPAADETSQPLPENTEAASTTGVAGSVQRPCLGETLARAVIAGKLNEDTTESRLHLLARQDLAGLHRQLPRLVAHLRADLVEIDWVQLLLDLATWDTQRGWVTKRWVQAYHRTLARSGTMSPQSPAATPEGDDA